MKIKNRKLAVLYALIKGRKERTKDFYKNCIEPQYLDYLLAKIKIIDLKTKIYPENILSSKNSKIFSKIIERMEITKVYDFNTITGIKTFSGVNLNLKAWEKIKKDLQELYIGKIKSNQERKYKDYMESIEKLD